MKHFYQWKFCRLLLGMLTVAGMSTHAWGQVPITGRVTSSEGGESLPGVNVVLKGTTEGTITDIDGKYAISVPSADATLIFSYIGHVTQEVVVGDRSVINVTMAPDVHTLNEVVVVGYGTQEKVNMTGAVSAVKIDDKITSRSLTNVSSGLSGLVPGLSAIQSTGMAGANGAELVIRGLSTVNGNSAPLVVVDGMPDVDINRLNMNDIESISVLKDAASAAVYGSRGANGVILITTRSGKGAEGTSINYSGSYAHTVPTRAYEFMADYPRALTLHQRRAATNTLRENQLFKDGTIDQWMALGMIDPLRYPNTDWWDIITRDGALQNHNVSLSGGNDRSNFFISLGLMDERGLQINNDYSRYNARFNYDYKVRDNMNVGVKFNGNWSKWVYALEDGFTDDTDNTAGFDMQYAIAGITPYDPVSGYFGGVMAYGEDPQAYNPYTLYINNLNNENRQEVNPYFYFDWSPVKGLTARVDYSINYYNQFRYSASMPNRAYNFQAGSFGSRVYVGENAGVGNYTNTGYKTMLSGRLNFKKKIAKNHDIGALFVYSEEYWYNRYQASSRNDRLHPSLHEIDAALTDIQSTGGNSNEEGLRSYIGRLNYTAFDKYLFEASFRYDGSSKFLPGSQFGFFPSAAVGWRFTEESFLQPVLESWLTSGKFRASYGSLGNNRGVGRYEQQETLDANNYMIGGDIVKGFVYSKMVNLDLTWESTSVLNFGLELGFLNNRLTAEIDYYDRLTTDMLRGSRMSVHLTGAYDAPRTNIGEMRNRGVELNLGWRDAVGRVNYFVNLNASRNANTLEKWEDFLGLGSSSGGNWIFIDMPYGYLYSYEDMGIAQTWQDVYNATPQGASPGDLLRKDLNGDGRIDGNDRKAHPNTQRSRPTTFFGLNGTVSWKGIDLTFLLQGATGRKDFWINIYNNVNFNNSRYASTWNHWNEPWSVENRDGAWPRLGGAGANRELTTFWLDDMTYLRLKNIQLGYSVPDYLLEKIRLKNIRLFASAENLHTWTKFRGLDPEKAAHANDAYPLNKSYSVGINIGI